MTQNAVNFNNPVDVANGGTGSTTLVADALLLGNGAGALQTVTLAGGEMLVGSGAGAPVATTLGNGELFIGGTTTGAQPATLTAGTNISITNGDGSITIDASGALAWNIETSDITLTAAVGAIAATTGAAREFTLPVTANVGDTFYVIDEESNANPLTIAQNATQSIRFGNQVTTTGVGGSLVSTQQGDCLTIVCTAQNTAFTVFSSIGNWTVN